MSLGLCHSGADQRDYLYFIAEGYYKLKVSLNWCILFNHLH